MLLRADRIIDVNKCASQMLQKPFLLLLKWRCKYGFQGNITYLFAYNGFVNECSFWFRANDFDWHTIRQAFKNFDNEQ